MGQLYKFQNILFSKYAWGKEPHIKKKIFILGQSTILHVFVSVNSSSSQSFPPFEATGLLHDLSRSANPDPQVNEHGVHSLHSPGLPSIAMWWW